MEKAASQAELSIRLHVSGPQSITPKLRQSHTVSITASEHKTQAGNLLIKQQQVLIVERIGLWMCQAWCPEGRESMVCDYGS